MDLVGNAVSGPAFQTGHLLAAACLNAGEAERNGSADVLRIVISTVLMQEM